MVALVVSDRQRHHPRDQQLATAKILLILTLATFRAPLALSAAYSWPAMAAKMAAMRWNRTGLYGTVQA
jgi:hypothetical protein